MSLFFHCWDGTQRLLNANNHSSICCTLNPSEVHGEQMQKDRVSGWVSKTGLIIELESSRHWKPPETSEVRKIKEDTFRGEECMCVCVNAWRCVCLCVCMCTCAHTCVFCMLCMYLFMQAHVVHLHPWEGQNRTSWSIIGILIYCFQYPCMKVSHWTWNLSFWLGWLASKLLGSSGLCLPREVGF